MSNTGTAALTEAYAFFGVDVATPSELECALAAEPAIYEAREHIAAELRRLDAETAQRSVGPGQPPGTVRIPTIGWGEWLRLLRRDTRGSPNLSQVAAATRISEVFPCTARHLSELERAAVKPTSPDQLTRAMLLTILCGADPIWTRYNYGLTRWECGGITMDQARVLNAGWADLVDHMNDLVKQRPPRWDVPGLLD